MENVDYKLQEIKELADNFNSLQIELNNKIEDYIVETLRKFNGDFIEFDSEQKETTRYLHEGQVMTLVSIQLEYYNSPYVGLTFVDDYENSVDTTLSDMTTDQQISIVEDITHYIKKYDYKNTNDMDAEE